MNFIDTKSSRNHKLHISRSKVVKTLFSLNLKTVANLDLGVKYGLNYLKTKEMSFSTKNHLENIDYTNIEQKFPICLNIYLVTLRMK